MLIACVTPMASVESHSFCSCLLSSSPPQSQSRAQVTRGLRLLGRTTARCVSRVACHSWKTTCSFGNANTRSDLVYESKTGLVSSVLLSYESNTKAREQHGGKYETHTSVSSGKTDKHNVPLACEPAQFESWRAAAGATRNGTPHARGR
jgi:hypothetical protein